MCSPRCKATQKLRVQTRSSHVLRLLLPDAVIPILHQQLWAVELLGMPSNICVAGKMQVGDSLIQYKQEGKKEIVDLHKLSAKEARAAVLCVLCNIQVCLACVCNDHVKSFSKCRSNCIKMSVHWGCMSHGNQLLQIQMHNLSQCHMQMHES